MPIGLTWKDISPDHLYALASRAAASSRRLLRPHAALKRRNKLFIPLKPLRGGRGARVNERGDLWMHDRVMICNHYKEGILFIDLAAPERCYEFNFPNRVITMKRHLLENNSTAIVAVAIRGSVSDSLRLEEFSLAQDGVCGMFEHIQTHLVLQLPRGVDVKSFISLRDAYVVALTLTKVLVIEWKKKKGFVTTQPDGATGAMLHVRNFVPRL